AAVIGEDGHRGQVPRLDQDVSGTAPERQGPRTLAPDHQSADPPPRGLQLHRRDPTRRHHAQALPPALRRLRSPMAVRDLPRQPRRLPRIALPHRPAHRHLPRRTRHRLRPLPQRPHRLDLTPTNLRAGPLTWRLTCDKECGKWACHSTDTWPATGNTPAWPFPRTRSSSGGRWSVLPRREPTLWAARRIRRWRPTGRAQRNRTRRR